MKIKQILLFPTIVLASLLLTACLPSQPKNNQENQTKNEETKSGQANGDENITGNLKSLLGMNKSLKCTWSMNDEGIKNEGVTYVKGNKSRSEMKTEIPEQGEMNVISITDGEWFYSWDTKTKQGTKMKLTEMETEIAEAPESNNDQGETEMNYEQMMEQNINYQCQATNIDDVMFVPPTDAQFVDLTESLKEMEEQAEQMKANMCQLCEMLPTDQKADCLADCQ